ncbi:hypothetical protein GWL_26280 [Herbaspirillum sp. GW103]|nr:hypothetical protein GWL_26280 [Herbaspirillum sp. GW103]
MVRQPGHGNVSGVLWCGTGDGFSFTLGRLHRGRRIIVVVCPDRLGRRPGGMRAQASHIQGAFLYIVIRMSNIR